MGKDVKPPQKPATLGDHFDDLRRAVFRSVIVPVVLVCAIWPFWTYIFIFIRDGLLTPEQISRLASIRALDTFSMSVRLSFYVGMVLSVPWIVWNLWWFIKPGLYPHERRFGHIAIPSSMLLFVAGISFGYFFVIPATLSFLLEFGREIAPQQIQDVQDLFDLVFALLFVMGGTFQIPLVVGAAVRFRLLKPEWITKHRRIVIFTSAVLGAVLTPTGDIVTMTLVGAPIYFLIEGGVLIGRVWKFYSDKRAAKEPKSILAGFQEGLASGVDQEGGMLGGDAAENFGETLRRLSREFAGNVKEGLDEFQRDRGDTAKDDDDDGDDGPDGTPKPPTPPTPPAPSGGAAAGAVASAPAPTQAQAVTSATPAAPPVDTSKAPVSPTAPVVAAPNVLSPRAPLDGPSDAALGVNAIASTTPASPGTSDANSPHNVPMLPRELRRRIDAYIELRLTEILGEVRNEASKSGGPTPDSATTSASASPDLKDTP